LFQAGYVITKLPAELVKSNMRTSLIESLAQKENESAKPTTKKKGVRIGFFRLLNKVDLSENRCLYNLGLV